MDLRYVVVTALVVLAGWLTGKLVAAVRQRRHAAARYIDASHRVNPATVVGNWYGRGERRDPWK